MRSNECPSSSVLGCANRIAAQQQADRHWDRLNVAYSLTSRRKGQTYRTPEYTQTLHCRF